MTDEFPSTEVCHVLSVADAINAVLDEVEPRAATTLLLDEVRGLTLARDIVSDCDSPPFDKCQMDGFAVRAEDVAQPPATLRVIGTVTAGQMPQRKLESGEATRVMTGAPLPPGADAVVPIERCHFLTEADRVVVNESPDLGAFIIRRGTSVSQGDVVLAAGTVLEAAQMGLLAEFGHAEVEVFPRPTVGILATGDELVHVHETPGPGQIRNSNQTMLAAQIARMGGEPLQLGIARDDPDHLRSKIAAGLECDILCLSGGVSLGTHDLVPSLLEAAGVRRVFHTVQMKPGKPVWFGKLDTDAAAVDRPSWIFGLPGNPVSSMVCCELFVRAAVRKLMGRRPAEPPAIEARLEQDHSARGDRPTYFPAKLTWSAGGASACPVDWRGSFDLRATADANSMILFPPGTRTYLAGEQVLVYEW